MFDIFFIFKFAIALRSNCTEQTTIDINQFGFEEKKVRFKNEWERERGMKVKIQYELSNPLRVPFGGSVKYLLFFDNEVKVWKPQRKVKTNRIFHLNEVCSEMFFFSSSFSPSTFRNNTFIFHYGNTWHIRSQVCHLGFLASSTKLSKIMVKQKKMMHYLT